LGVEKYETIRNIVINGAFSHFGKNYIVKNHKDDQTIYDNFVKNSNQTDQNVKYSIKSLRLKSLNL
jgi:hypothetical protein